MALVGGLIESDAVRTRGRAYPPRLLFSIKVEAADKIARIIVEVFELIL